LRARTDVARADLIVRHGLEDTSNGVQVTVDQSNVDTQERADHGAKNWQCVLEVLKKLVEEQAR
jgi:hypothetical protein